MIELLLVAERLLAGGDLQRAEHLFGQVAEADPRNAIAIVGLARVALERGDLVGALDAAHRALAIDPDEAAAQRLILELTRDAAGSDSAVSDAARGGTASPDLVPSEEAQGGTASPDLATSDATTSDVAAPDATTSDVAAPESPKPAGRSLIDRLLRLIGLRH